MDSTVSGRHPSQSGQQPLNNVRKCKNFLSTLMKLTSSRPEQTVKNVRHLIQELIDGKVDPKQFTEKLQIELKSSHQPYLVPFLKKNLPDLRQCLIDNTFTIQGVKAPPLEVLQQPAIPTIQHSDSVPSVPYSSPLRGLEPFVQQDNPWVIEHEKPFEISISNSSQPTFLTETVIGSLRADVFPQQVQGLQDSGSPSPPTKKSKYEASSVSQMAQVLSGKKDWDHCLQKDHGRAEWKCVNCDDYFCTSCIVVHKMGKKTGSHRLLNVRERFMEDAVREEVFCSIHEEQELDIYCVTDRKAICVLCERGKDHKEHETTAMEKYTKKLRSDVGSSLTKANNLIPWFKNELEKVLNSQRDISTYFETVDTNVEVIVAKLKQNAKNLKWREITRLEDTEEELRKQQEAVWSKVSDTKNFLENCTQTELIKQGENRIEELKAVVHEADATPFYTVVQSSNICHELTKNLNV